MSYYAKYTKKVYEPSSTTPFPLSRSKIESFVECPRCFYMDARLGTSKPSIPQFTLNSAVDNLLKNEFDLLRQAGEKHELMKLYNIDAVPLVHPDLAKWRDDAHTYEGISVIHQPTNFKISGLIDDVWVDREGKFIMVDYKSTSTTKEISLDDQYKQAYKRQMEVYQWIFRQSGFQVLDTGYFVFANADKNLPKFDGKLIFKMSIVEHKGNDSWIEPTLMKIKDTLDSTEIPEQSPDCEYCSYRKQSAEKVALWKSEHQKK